MNFGVAALTNCLMRPRTRLWYLPGIRHARLGCGVLIGVLCACTTPQPRPDSPAAPSSAAPPAPSRPLPNINLSGYPPAFRDGFRDGCDSFRGGYRRDNSRFGKDNDYTIGWQDGFSICRRQGK